MQSPESIAGVQTFAGTPNGQLWKGFKQALRAEDRDAVLDTSEKLRANGVPLRTIMTFAGGVLSLAVIGWYTM